MASPNGPPHDAVDLLKTNKDWINTTLSKEYVMRERHSVHSKDTGSGRENPGNGGGWGDGGGGGAGGGPRDMQGYGGGQRGFGGGGGDRNHQRDDRDRG
jgi:hypothetical protein